MDTEAYLHRMNYHGPREPALDTLRALHKAHMLAVPFENLDIHLGRPIVLDQDWLYRKIVGQRRGGFCYELNGLFAALLRELGYEVTLLSARVGHEQGSFGPEFDHLVLLVSLDRQWLADVGFGSSFCEPLLLSDQGQQIEGRYTYRLARAGGDWTLLARESEGVWSETYLFTLQPRQFADFFDMCQFHQTSPQSPFTQRRVCTRATEDGRITLTHDRFIVTSRGHREEHPLVDEDDFAARLQEHFGIVLNTRFPQSTD